MGAARGFRTWGLLPPPSRHPSSVDSFEARDGYGLCRVSLGAGRRGRTRVGGFGEKVSFIWSVADLLRGPYKPAAIRRVILPLTVLRRLDCVLEPTKAKVLAKFESLKRR